MCLYQIHQAVLSFLTRLLGIWLHAKIILSKNIMKETNEQKNQRVVSTYHHYVPYQP